MLKFSSPSPVNIHLLIVQRDRTDADLIINTLRANHQSVTYDFANTLETCKAYLKKVQYDAVVSAYKLSNFTALDVWQWQQEQINLKIPFILIAGTIGEKTIANCLRAGISDYINQQYLSELPEVLQRSLVEVSLQRQEKIAIAQMRASAKREAIINQIVHAMHGTLVLDEVLQTTVDLLHPALNLSRCLVAMLDRDQQLKVRYASMATKQRSELIGKPCYFFDFYQNILKEGNPVLISNIEQADLPNELLSMARNHGIRAVFIAPLRNQDTYLGNLCLHQCDRDREWTDDDLILMNTISDQCAIAIQRAKLFEQVQQQAIREQLLNEMSRELNSQLEPNSILAKIVQHTGEYFQVDRVVIFSIHNQEVKAINEWKAKEDVPSLVGFKAPLSEWNHPASKSELQGHCFLGESNQEQFPKMASWDQQVYQGEIQSLLRVPIYIREQFFGAISLHMTTEDRVFDADEIHLLERIADQAAIALYNAQSYERLEQLVKQRTQELEEEKILSEAANRTKTEFLNNMSHELRTPLTGILGFSNVLTQEFFGTLTEKQKQYISGISECGEQLLNLINDLLDLSKIEANEAEFHPQNLIVEEICKACLSLVKERAKTQGIELNNEIEETVSFCIGDLRQVKQILFNLLSNAIKFTKSGSVTLKVWQNDSRIYFSVIDTGIGIPEAEKALIFKPFHQLDQGLSRQYEGTGLGLALSQKLAQMHGGDITLESQLGQGSCFTLWLPLNLEQIQKECPLAMQDTSLETTVNDHLDQLTSSSGNYPS
jgi:signal transduction histidine kinase/CheY-like chemotaxis protein